MERAGRAGQSAAESSRLRRQLAVSFPHRPDAAKVFWVGGRKLGGVRVSQRVVQGGKAAPLQLTSAREERGKLRWHLLRQVSLLARVLFDLAGGDGTWRVVSSQAKGGQLTRRCWQIVDRLTLKRHGDTAGSQSPVPPPPRGGGGGQCTSAPGSSSVRSRCWPCRSIQDRHHPSETSCQ